MTDSKEKTQAVEGTQAQATGEPQQAPRYSKKLKATQKAEKRVTSAQHRMADAIVSGIQSWERSREKSAHKKKDGAVKDALENYAKAYAKVVEESSRVPRDLVKGVLALYPKKVRKFWGF